MYIFNPDTFRSLYPEFASLTDEQIMNAYYGSLQYSNMLTRGYTDNNQIGYIINLVVAHLLEMSPLGSGGASGSGRISSATTGSVSTSLSYNDSKSGWFWNSTSYGQIIYQMMLNHGGATYVIGKPFRYKCTNRYRSW